MAGGGFIYSLAKGADNLLIGRFYGADSIGLYSRAAALLNRPLEQFLFPISSVFVPALSRLQTDPERYRRTFLRVYESMALLSCFFTALLFALSRPLTLVVDRAKVGEGSDHFCRVYFSSVIRSGCKSFLLVIC